MMELKIVNNTAFLIMNKALLNVKDGVRRGFLAVGPEIKKEVIKLIKGHPKTGRYYIINGKLHQASAPGEPPADLTGNLADSVNYRGRGSSELVIGDRADMAPYAKYLEGFVPNRIAPRPHLRPAVLNKRREIEQAIELSVKLRLKNWR